jgi:NADH:ubiquinone oxidoreductase subunit C
MQSPCPQAPTPPQPSPTRIAVLCAKVKDRFPDTTIDWVKERRAKLTVTKEEIKDVALFIRDELGFDHLSIVSGTDYIAKNEIEVIYFVGSLSRPGYEDIVLGLAERPKRDDPVVPSLVEVWPAADYQERETHEMLGINFKGHPNQKHFLLPEDWNDLPPLRKDYISPGR